MLRRRRAAKTAHAVPPHAQFEKDDAKRIKKSLRDLVHSEARGMYAVPAPATSMEIASLLCVPPEHVWDRAVTIFMAVNLYCSLLMTTAVALALNPLKLSKESNYWLAFAYNTLLAALAALSVMSTMITLFSILACSGSTPETIYAAVARAGFYVKFISLLWWQTLIMLALVSVAAWLKSGWFGGAVATGVVFVVFQLLQHVFFIWGNDAFPHIAMPWNPIGAPLLDKPRDRRRAEHRARTMVANAEPWLGDIARRVATEEPKAEDTDDEGESWEDSKKPTDDGALDHIVASALKGAVPSRRSAVRDLLLSNGVTSDVLIHASGSAAGAQLVLHALDELAERHTPNGLHVGERLALATEVSHIVRRYAVDATTDETPAQPPVTPPPPPGTPTTRSRATSPKGDPGE
uniref:Uncharacterized protein n=1 Tax=Pelagomonas calceolata TaxID=35677 RepID=A0A7S3ZVX3_9STRA|mmetsp:Transcript_15748/g.44799  ORF Transcript_15748/g.44799 Transcript_15748/m.44799 type:complete len:406 (-) Transcript_15748:28-1245(-)